MICVFEFIVFILKIFKIFKLFYLLVLKLFIVEVFLFVEFRFFFGVGFDWIM